MTTLANDAKAARITDVHWSDYVLSAGAAAILIAVIAALVRGAEHLGKLPLNVWAHLITILIAGFFTFPFNRLLGGWLFGAG
jgi:hypothetical protein